MKVQVKDRAHWSKLVDDRIQQIQDLRKTRDAAYLTAYEPYRDKVNAAITAHRARWWWNRLLTAIWTGGGFPNLLPEFPDGSLWHSWEYDRVLNRPENLCRSYPSKICSKEEQRLIGVANALDDETLEAVFLSESDLKIIE